MTLSSRDMVRMFRALSDPTRVEIVQLVSASPRNVSELTSLVGVSQPKVSRHLKILRDAGLLNDVRRGKWVWYEIAPPSDGEQVSAMATAMSMLFGGSGAGTAGGSPGPSLKEVSRLPAPPKPAGKAVPGEPPARREVPARRRAPARKEARSSKDVRAPRETPPARPQKAPAKAPAKDMEDFLL